MPLLSLLYPLYTFGRPFIWQALNKYFFDLYWITTSCFPSKNCIACSSFPWNFRTNANSFLFLFTTRIACQKLQKFSLCFFSHFSCQCANTHHGSYLYHQSPLCLFNQVCYSPLLNLLSILSVFFQCLALDLFPCFVLYQWFFVSLRASGLKSLPSLSYLCDRD